MLLNILADYWNGRILICFLFTITAVSQSSSVNADDPSPLTLSQFLPETNVVDALHVDRARDQLLLQDDFGSFGSPAHPFKLQMSVTAPSTTPMEEALITSAFHPKKNLNLPRIVTTQSTYSNMTSLYSPYDNLLFFGNYPFAGNVDSYFNDSNGVKFYKGFGDSAGVMKNYSVAISKDGTLYNVSPVYGINKIIFPDGEEISILYSHNFYGCSRGCEYYTPKSIVSSWGYGLEFRYENSGGSVYYYDKSKIYCDESTLSSCAQIPIGNKILSFVNEEVGQGNDTYRVQVNRPSGPAWIYNTSRISAGDYDYGLVDSAYRAGSNTPFTYKYYISAERDDLTGPYLTEAHYGNLGGTYFKSGPGGEEGWVTVNGKYEYYYGVKGEGYLSSYLENSDQKYVPRPAVGGFYRTMGVVSNSSSYAFGRDDRGNLTSVVRNPKPGSSQASITVLTAIYPNDTSASPDGCANRVICNKPTSVTDARGGTMNYTWDSTHGGILSVMRPAPTSGAARPLQLTTYAQRYAWILNSSGVLVQASSPIWVVATQTECQTSAGSNLAVCDTAAQQIVTTYEYGAAGTVDAMRVKGLAVTANGKTLRTCYGYDAFGHRISETRPNAQLASCP